MADKVEKEFGSVPMNRQLGFKDTLLHVVKSELTMLVHRHNRGLHCSVCFKIYAQKNMSEIICTHHVTILCVII